MALKLSLTERDTPKCGPSRNLSNIKSLISVPKSPNIIISFPEICKFHMERCKTFVQVVSLRGISDLMDLMQANINQYTIEFIKVRDDFLMTSADSNGCK